VGAVFAATDFQRRGARGGEPAILAASPNPHGANGNVLTVSHVCVL